MEKLTEHTKIKNVRTKERWRKLVLHVYHKQTGFEFYKYEILIDFSIYGNPNILFIDPETQRIGVREFDIKKNEHYLVTDLTIGEIDNVFWNKKRIEYETHGKQLRQKFENYKDSFLEIFNDKKYEQRIETTEE